MTEKLQSVKIRIGRKYYPIKLSEPEMKQLQTIERDINEKILGYQLAYKNIDQQDCIAMTLIEYVFNKQKITKDKTEPEVLESLERIQKKLDSVNF